MRSDTETYTSIPTRFAAVSAEDLSKSLGTTQCDTTISLLKYIQEHPYRASFKRSLPTFINRVFYGSYKTDAFQLAKHLNLIGLQDELPILIQQGSLSGIMNHLYSLFEGDKLKGTDKGGLKKLKKLVNKFARRNGFECRLFDLNKYRDELKKDRETADDADKEKIIHQLKAISASCNHYVYIKDPIFIPKYYSKKERARRRRKRIAFKAGAFAAALILGFGEGLVAAMFFAPTLLAILLVGGPAGIANFILTFKDSYQIIKDIFSGNILKKPNGDPLTGIEKGFVCGSLIFSFCAGSAFGFLSFGSGVTALGILGTVLGISALAGPLGWIIAGIVTVGTAMALFTIYSYITVNWVRNGGLGKLKNKILNIKKEFINYFKPENKKWSQLTKNEKIQHIAEKVIASIFAFLTFSTIGLVVLLTMPFFKGKCFIVFHKMFHVSKLVSEILAQTIIFGLGAIVNAVFYARGIVKVFRRIKSGIISAFIHPVQTGRKIKAYYRSITANPIRLLTHVKRFLKLTFLMSCVFQNSVLGQAKGFRDSSTSVNAVHTATGLPAKAAADAVEGAMICGSGGPNTVAAIGSLELPAVIESQENVRENAFSGCSAIPVSSNRNSMFACRKHNYAHAAEIGMVEDDYSVQTRDMNENDNDIEQVLGLS